MDEYNYEAELSVPSAPKRVPPNDTEAELAAVSAMLLDREALAAGYELLKPEDFYRPDYKALFETMSELFALSKPVDLVTLKAKLDERGLFDAVGGRDMMVLLAGNQSTSANIRQYCKIISDKSVYRQLLRAADGIAATAFAAKKPVNEALDEAERAVFDIAQKRNTTNFSHIRDVLITSINNIEEASKTGGRVTGVETGFSDFDLKTTGLHPSELILIAARPAVGKSALGINIVHHAAVRKGIPTALFTLEMSKEQVVNRMLSAEAMVEGQKLRTGMLDQNEWQRVAQAVSPLASAPIFIDDTAGISITELRAKCRRQKLEQNLGLVVIDYLQLMTGSRRSENRQQEIGEISRSLKVMANELNLPVLALAQLSRAPELRTANHRPMLSDLRESGEIEQNADVVTFIYRDELYNPETTEKRGVAEWIIAKQRNGSTGTVELLFMGQYTKFGSMAR
jgi:replicative DNA helicase